MYVLTSFITHFLRHTATEILHSLGFPTAIVDIESIRFKLSCLILYLYIEQPNPLSP